MAAFASCATTSAGSNHGGSSSSSGWWLLLVATAHSVVVGLSCGIVGYQLASCLDENEDDKDEERMAVGGKISNHKQELLSFSKLFYIKVKRMLFSKSLWEATVPWWLVLACPSPWYPLALWFVVSTTAQNETQQEERQDETRQDEKQQVSSSMPSPFPHSDPFASTTTHYSATIRTAPEPPHVKTRRTAAAAASVTNNGRSDSLSSLPSSVEAGTTATSRHVVPPPKRYLEMLVHNVSHTDLVLSANAPPLPQECDADKGSMSNAHSQQQLNKVDHDNHATYCLCAPRFSAFDMYCRRILSTLSGKEEVVQFPKYERSESSPRYSIVSPKPSRQGKLNTGLCLVSSSREVPSSNIDDALTIPTDELPNLRFRGRDAHRIEPYYNYHEDYKENDDDATKAKSASIAATTTRSSTTSRSSLQLSHVFFPLLATLLPRWQRELSQKYNHHHQQQSSSSSLSSSIQNKSVDHTDHSNNNSSTVVKQVVVLVSGVGTPRNWTHSITGNSTRACAQLMEQFIQRLYPQVTVVRIHSDTNIFRYDENILFVKRELMPCIDAYRDAHARGLPYPDETRETIGGNNSTSTPLPPFSPDWKQSLSVTLSFADGSHARTHAIQTSLRPYRPTYFHLWQLKTFWHDTKIVEDDLEVHSFEDMETVPAMDVKLMAQADRHVDLVVQEMMAFRNDFLRSMQDETNDITKFWLRKTQKPVLAVLLVQSDDGKRGRPVLYRGTNMEVSMPTGSLCAERNVIGSALASNPALKRQDLKMVAVLAVPLQLARHQQQEVVRPPNMPRSTSLASYSSVQQEEEDDDETDWVLAAQGAGAAALAVEKISAQESIPVYHVGDGMLSSPLEQHDDARPRSTAHTPPGTPVRRITLYSQAQEASGPVDGGTRPTMGMGRSKKLKKTILVHSVKDLNPLRPCGACNEWLKKICECNPYFKVLTFTDADCNGVYVSPCQD